jgi:hypothetical protein
MKKNFEIDTLSKIYICCPANIATGGPELLNQLCKELRSIGLDSYIYYIKTKEGVNPIPREYLEYNNPFVFSIEDNKKNILIVGEKNSNLFVQYSKIQKAIWWLSVDNYYKCVSKDNYLLHRFKKTFSFLLQNKSNHFVFWKPDTRILHLVQSEYANFHLTKYGINKDLIFYLSDYINPKFSDNLFTNHEDKQNIVLYSPAKGFEFTKKLINYSKDIIFVALKGMSKEEMLNYFRISKVYIDFGNHPGKDRIPREAALSDLCIITNKSGSANFFNDVPIPSNYKFRKFRKNIKEINFLIKDCLVNYELHIQNFKEYKSKIKDEKNQFQNDVRKIFKF